MEKNRLTRWFLSGFIIYGVLALLFGLLASVGGAIAFSLFCAFGAFCCLFKLWLDRA